MTLASAFLGSLLSIGIVIGILGIKRFSKRNLVVKFVSVAT
jgi:hypothetical protein